MKSAGRAERVRRRAPFARRGERLAPALSGILLAISFPPFELLVPPFVALVPFLLFVEDRAPGREGRWSAARGGFVLGGVYFGLLLYWLVIALIHYSLLAIPAYVLTVLVLAGFTGSFGAALHYVRERVPVVPLAVAAALLWTGIEWVQGNLGDLSFPWLGLGSALAAFPRVAGAADLVGARGLTVWLAFINGLVATAILAYRAGRPVSRLAAALAVTVALPIGYGFWRAATLEVRPAARVAVVQPNIPEDLKLQRAQAIQATLDAVTELMGRIPPGSVDLVVWPEVTLPAILEHPYESFLQEPIREMSERVGAPIVAGAYGLDGGEGDDFTLFNSIFIFGPDGFTGERYDKKYLVPFVERIPFVDPAWFERIVGSVRYFGGLGRGQGAPAFTAGDARYGVLICYESIFAQHSRAYRLNGADYLVNATNDAWYGREPWYARTSALWQHPAHMTMRAIEHRVGVARAANTGISMFIDPLGRSYERTRLFERDVRIATVYTTDAVTLFARWGDWLATGATVAAAFLVLAGRLTRGRPDDATSP